MYSHVVKRHFVIGVAFVAACHDRELQQLAAARDAVCACKTVACAERALGEVPREPVSSTPRAQRLAREMLDCLAEVYEAARPSTDPDALVEPAP